MKRLCLTVTILVLAATIMTASRPEPSKASHPWPLAGWGYYLTWKALYPAQNGTLTYRIWSVDSQPVPQRDALLLLDAIDNHWESILDFILVLGGDREFSFIAKAYNDASADATYVRMNDDAQVEFVCGPGTVTACFKATSSTAYLGRTVVTKATIPYGPAVYDFTDDPVRHTLAHEWGHGLGLSHHANCDTVMTNVSCSTMPSDADGATVIDTVYGY